MRNEPAKQKRFSEQEGALRTNSSDKAASKKLNLILLAALAPFCIILTIGCNDSGKKLFNKSPFKPFVGDITEESKKIVRQSLSDQDPAIRVKAIEVVATTRQVGMMPTVTRMLTDDVVPVRFAAALAVGDIKYILAKQKAYRLVNEAQNQNVKIAAAYALYKMGQTQYFDTIQKALNNTDPVVRANAVYLLGKTGDKKALKSLYFTMNNLNDPSDKVRYVAVEAIARIGDRWIYPNIWKMMISAYSDVKTAGVKAMGLLGTEKAQESLGTMFDDNILEVRLAAARELGRLGDNSGEKIIHNVFKKNLIAGKNKRDEERIKFFTAMAIGRICTKSVKKYLPRLLTDQSTSVKLTAAKAVLLCASGKKMPAERGN